MGSLSNPEGGSDPVPQRDKVTGLPTGPSQGHILTPDDHTIQPMHLSKLKAVSPGQEGHLQPSGPPTGDLSFITPDDIK